MSYEKALQNPVFKTIQSAAEALELDAYAIGGFVRDFLLKRGDAKDIDVVAIGSGIALAKKTAQLLPDNPNVQVFKRFGTAMLKTQDI